MKKSVVFFSVVTIITGLVFTVPAFASQTDNILSENIKEADGTTGQDTNSGSGVKTGHIQDGAVTDAKITGPISSSKISSTGLDADTVDGKHASDLAPVIHAHEQTDVNGLSGALAEKRRERVLMRVHTPTTPTIHTMNATAMSSGTTTTKAFNRKCTGRSVSGTLPILQGADDKRDEVFNATCSLTLRRDGSKSVIRTLALLGEEREAVEDPLDHFNDDQPGSLASDDLVDPDRIVEDAIMPTIEHGGTQVAFHEGLHAVEKRVPEYDRPREGPGLCVYRTENSPVQEVVGVEPV